MTESKQIALAGLTHASFELITIQSVSQCPESLTFMICAKARAVTSRTIKVPPKSAAKVTRLLQPNDLNVSRHIKVLWSLIACKLCKKHSRKTSNLELLVLHGPFYKIRFSIDGRFQKCIIVVKVFRDDSENLTFYSDLFDKIFVGHESLSWSETKNLTILIPDKIFFLYLIISKLCTLKQLKNIHQKLKLKFS